MIKHHNLPLECKKCDWKGTDYNIKEAGPHLEATCPKCKKHIKFVSHANKYGTKEQKIIMWGKTKGRCCYCGERLNTFEKRGMNTEHIYPQSKGGGHEIDNLMLSCESCNKSKSGKTLDEYRMYVAKKRKKTKHVFYFEILECSTIGEILKKIF